MREAIDIADLVRAGVAVIVATRDEDRRPQLSRAWGPALSEDGARLTVCVEAAPDSEMARTLRPGSPVAAMLARLTSHTAVQLKGATVAFGPPTPERLEAVADHIARFVAETALVGVSEATARTLVGTDLMTLTIAVAERTDETPGPSTGRPL